MRFIRNLLFCVRFSDWLEQKQRCTHSVWCTQIDETFHPIWMSWTDAMGCDASTLSSSSSVAAATAVAAIIAIAAALALQKHEDRVSEKERWCVCDTTCLFMDYFHKYIEHCYQHWAHIFWPFAKSNSNNANQCSSIYTLWHIICVLVSFVVTLWIGDSFNFSLDWVALFLLILFSCVLSAEW